MEDIKEVLKRSREYEDALSETVKLSYREVDRLVIEKLIRCRQRCFLEQNQSDLEAFDRVLIYFLGKDDFQKYVLNNNQ